MKRYRLLYIGFAAVLVLLSSVVLLSQRYMSQWNQSDQREAYTFGVIQKLDRLLFALSDVSKSQRDYTRTGAPQHLDSYRQARERVERELASLKELSRDHPKLRGWIARIEPLVRERLSEREQALRAPASGAVAGSTTSERIRREIAAVQDEAIGELRDISARQVTQLTTVQRLLVADAAIILALVLLVFILLRRDLASRLRTEQELIERRDELERLVRTRTRELESSNEELHRERRLAEEARRDLAAHQDAIREEERLALARELHDEIGQNLTALKLDLSWMERRLPAGSDEIAGRLQAMLARLDGLIDTTRHLSAELRPPMLDNLGLPAALEWQAAEFRRSSGLECDLTLQDGIQVRGAQLATNLLRVCQEALTNVLRHAGASQVFISLCERSGRLRLEISDNGRGITGPEMDSPTAYGIMGMRERARLCGGVLTITGSPEEGTTLRLEVPLERAKEEA